MVKTFFQANNVCLIKIQIESNIQKWATLMKQVTEFLQIRAELSVKLADNSIDFCIFEIFMFLARLSCISAVFFLNFQKIDGSLDPIFILPLNLLTLATTHEEKF
jgi:hypothetical protein